MLEHGDRVGRHELAELVQGPEGLGSMPQRHRAWNCGAVCVTPPSSRRRRSVANEPSVSSTATAPEPPVSVASESLNISMLRPRSIRSIMMSLISRAVSHETTSPARIWPSSIRLAMSTMPLSTPRQALLRS